MKETITKNEKSIKALYALISSGYYKGEVLQNRFDLARTVFPNNHKIKGVLNADNQFEIKSTYSNSFMEVSAKSILVVFIAFIIYSMFYFNWLVTAILLTFLFIFLSLEYFKRKKELSIFIDKYFVIKRQLK